MTDRSFDQAKSEVFAGRQMDVLHNASERPMTSQPDAVVRLADSQREKLVQVMSRAFFNDPTFLYISPDEKTRLDKLRWFLHMIIRYGTRYGEVYTTPTPDGGAIWTSPENTTFTFGQILHIGFLAMPFAFGWAGFARFMSLNDLKRLCRLVSPNRAFTLQPAGRHHPALSY